VSLKADPYRTAAEATREEPLVDRCAGEGEMGTGQLTRKTPSCPTPGFFSVLWHGIQSGDQWICRCGRCWVRKTTPYVLFFADYWCFTGERKKQ
jgi:hypothetical protein